MSHQLKKKVQPLWPFSLQRVRLNSQTQSPFNLGPGGGTAHSLCCTGDVEQKIVQINFCHKLDDKLIFFHQNRSHSNSQGIYSV